MKPTMFGLIYIVYIIGVVVASSMNVLGQNATDEGLTVQEWYPKFNHYVLKCGTAAGATYDWDFGGEGKLTNVLNNAVYHIFRTTGLRTVMCTERTADSVITRTLGINVETVLADNPAENTRAVSVDIEIADFYPKGNEYVFICNGRNFTPMAFTWNFGDGEQQVLSTNKDVFHRYDQAGTYTISCEAADEENIATGSMTATVPETTAQPSNATNFTFVVHENATQQAGTGTGARLHVEEHFPAQNAFVFFCEAINFNATRYNWFFGDGEKLLQIENSRVYHAYDEPGNYTAKCEATIIEGDTATVIVQEREAEEQQAPEEEEEQPANQTQNQTANQTLNISLNATINETINVNITGNASVEANQSNASANSS